MHKKHKLKSWLDKKLSNPKFYNEFMKEYEKLSIAEQLIRLRLFAGLTQSSLAKKVGTTASAISRYENADYDRYELQTLRKIVTACGGKLNISVEIPAYKKAA